MQTADQLDVFVARPGRFRSFRQLPELLREAQRFGTSIVYLWDYWEGAPGAPDEPYWNKGDYRPRGALGGPAALIDGIEAVHDAGGWVLCYLEPFIIYDRSVIAQKKGADWGRGTGRGPVRHLPATHHGGDVPTVAGRGRRHRRATGGRVRLRRDLPRLRGLADQPAPAGRLGPLATRL